MRYRSLFADSARWDGFEFRPSDIVISTPPKCGTTWVQMLCALLIFDGPDFPAPLDELSPWLDMCNQSIESVRAELGAQSHRRFIKTHTPLDGIPLRKEVTYIVVGRDPRDVAVSFEHHRANLTWHFLSASHAGHGHDGLAETDPRRPSSSIRWSGFAGRHSGRRFRRGPDARRGPASHADGLAAAPRCRRGDAALRRSDRGPAGRDAAVGHRARHPGRRGARLGARPRGGARSDARASTRARARILTRQLEGRVGVLSLGRLRRMARPDGRAACGRLRRGSPFVPADVAA